MIAANAIEKLSQVGPRTLERLHELSIFTFQDLLLHLPMRYEDRTKIQPIAKLIPGQTAFVQGKILHAQIIQAKRRTLTCVIQDHTGILHLSFFHFYRTQLKQMQNENSILRCFGDIQFGKNGYQMFHPEWKIFSEENIPPLDPCLTPVYPTTTGITQTLLRKLVQQTFAILDANEKLAAAFQELLPEDLRKKYEFPNLIEALRMLHFPKPEMLSSIENRTHPALQYCIATELLAHQLSLQELRKKIQSHTAPHFVSKKNLQKPFIQALPFQFTKAQERVIQEIEKDLTRTIPMQRLVLGDVGSGKTVVAAMAILQAVESGYQAALMVPTTLLAEQHTKNFLKWFTPLGVRVLCLSAGLSAKTEKNFLEQIASGDAQVVIGTHALFQDHVRFHNLGLVVVDEQHRFGVQQRLALKNKGVRSDLVPHQLIMTATPIPRTLAIFSYADLDISFLDEKPAGRKPITTVLINNQRRMSVIERVQANCKMGKQAYWVCPLIEVSADWPLQAAEKIAADLQTLCRVRVGLLHGRMKSTEKEKTMRAFLQKEIDLLVATTVIEVGVDVPNASLMVIENAERMGLAQLHQLRGRVGRGEEQSYCVLLYQEPLTPFGRERLELLKANQDGFKLAEADLKMRGPGEILGIRQSGAVELQVADWGLDQAFLPMVIELRKAISLENSSLNSHLIQFWLGAKGKMTREC